MSLAKCSFVLRVPFSDCCKPSANSGVSGRCFLCGGVDNYGCIYLILQLK